MNPNFREIMTEWRNSPKAKFNIMLCSLAIGAAKI